MTTGTVRTNPGQPAVPIIPKKKQKPRKKPLAVPAVSLIPPDPDLGGGGDESEY